MPNSVLEFKEYKAHVCYNKQGMAGGVAHMGALNFRGHGKEPKSWGLDRVEET